MVMEEEVKTLDVTYHVFKDSDTFRVIDGLTFRVIGSVRVCLVRV
jgi:hypothetical protein